MVEMLLLLFVGALISGVMIWLGTVVFRNRLEEARMAKQQAATDSRSSEQIEELKTGQSRVEIQEP